MLSKVLYKVQLKQSINLLITQMLLGQHWQMLHSWANTWKTTARQDEKQVFGFRVTYSRDILDSTWLIRLRSKLSRCNMCGNPSYTSYTSPDSKIYEANMGPIWGRHDPGGPHAGSINFAIWVHPFAQSLRSPMQEDQGTLTIRTYPGMWLSVNCVNWPGKWGYLSKFDCEDKSLKQYSPTLILLPVIHEKGALSISVLVVIEKMADILSHNGWFLNDN